MIAHRGASAYALEHSVQAYDLALEMGADSLELDVRLTLDEIAVIVHDRTLKRTTGDPRAVAEVRWQDLLDLDPAVRPLTLAYAVMRYGGSARLLLDLKDPRPPLERRVSEVVEGTRRQAAVEIQSFRGRGLLRVCRAAAGADVAQLYPPRMPSGLIRLDIGRVSSFATAIGPEAGSVDSALVDAAHSKGLRVQPYTVNEPDEIERLLGLGVDALITDAPDRARTAIDAAGSLAGAA